MNANGYDISNIIHTRYTKGSEYSLDGKDYVGEYHIINDKAYTGPSDAIGTKLLTRYYPNSSVYTYDSLFNFRKVESSFQQPKDAVITPTEGDYSSGVFLRYFLQSIIDPQKMPIEITRDGYESLGKTKGFDNATNMAFTVLWTLTGPLRSYLDNNGYVIQGIFEKNETEVLKSATAYPNIQYKLKNYVEFARPTFV